MPGLGPGWTGERACPTRKSIVEVYSQWGASQGWPSHVW